MSQENVESLRGNNDAFNRGDRAAWLSGLDPDAKMVPARDWPEKAPVHGREAIWDYYVEVTQAWEVGAFELGEIIEAGTDKLIVNVRRHARGRASGADLVFSYWNLALYREGQAIRIEWFAERAEALEAAGLSE
jgi:ketosteroid isomerase-like protein